mgnify:CR=1 FL=1
MSESINYGGIFDLEVKEEELAVLEKQSADPDLWNDQDKAQALLKKIGALRDLLNRWNEVSVGCDDLAELYEMAKAEESAELEESINSDFVSLEKKVAEMEIRKMLDGPDDACTALLSIHPGAGGTESQDWALMLYRMYVRFLERENMDFRVVEVQDGDEAGLKSATIEVNSEFAYGLLRSEIGVHRLVRISPFDANARRHTSFCAVYLYPVHEDIQFELDMSEVRVDTYRSSGAGGQYINKTDSAVRMTHLPTGIVASCQTERSQLQNKEFALKMLMSKLLQIKMQEQQKLVENIQGVKSNIEWGAQIRSYVFMPYTLVKDARTGYEEVNIQSVMDGGIDGFINAYLKHISANPEA